MTNEKGDAAFDSTDEVLAKRIINTTEKHGVNEDMPGNDSVPDYSFDAEDRDQSKPVMRNGKIIIIAVCTGIALLIIGILMFRRRK